MTDSDLMSSKNAGDGEINDYGAVGGRQWVQRMSVGHGTGNYNEEFGKELVKANGNAGDPPIHKTITFDNIDESMSNGEQIQVQPAAPINTEQ